MKITLTKLLLIATVIIGIFFYFYLDLNTYLTTQNFIKNKFKLLLLYENNPKIECVAFFDIIFSFCMMLTSYKVL